MSYRTRTDVDFRSIRTACLSGENGAGKSALLEAMTWAIWGKCRASSGRDIVTVGESQVEVTFDFQLGDRAYRVFRRQSVGARTSTTLEFYILSDDSGESDDWHAITGDSTRETDRKIVETLRLDYDTFINSAFLMQGKADAFTEKPPGERKRVLASILNLGDYDELLAAARDRERNLRARAQQMTGQIDRIAERIAGKPEIERELDFLSARLIESSNVVEVLESEVQAMQETLSAMSAILNNREAAERRQQRLAARLTELQQADAADQARLASLSELLAKSATIETNYTSLLKWRDIANRQADILRQRQPLETRLRELERSIEQKRNTLQRQLDMLMAQLDQSQQNVSALELKQSELASLTKEIDLAGDLTSDLGNARNALRARESEQAALEAECRSLRAAMNDIKANMDLLTTGEAECPVCRRPISSLEHQHVEELWTGEGTRLGNTFRAHRDRLKELDRLIPESAAAITALERQQEAINNRKTVASRLRQEVAALPALKEQALDLKRRSDEAAAQLEQRAFARDLETEIREFETKLNELAYDPEASAEAMRQMGPLQRAEHDYSELQTARTSLSHIQESIANRRGAVEDVTHELESLQEELNLMATQLADEPDLRARFNQRSDALQKARAERDHVQSRFGAVSGQMKQLDELADELQEIQKSRDGFTFDADACRELTFAFGRNGIQAMIVETILPELEDEANRLLSRMTSSHLQVRFRSTRQAVSNDNIIETLDIIIRDEAGERPYALYSGGEAFRVDFAIRVALSKLLARRAGTTIDMLIIDEGFGTQDVRGRDGLIEALRTVEQDFATILVITHIDDVRDMFPTRINITKTEDGSTVAVA